MSTNFNHMDVQVRRRVCFMKGNPQLRPRPGISPGTMYSPKISYRSWDSNPDCHAPRACASCRWARAAHAIDGIRTHTGGVLNTVSLPLEYDCEIEGQF